MSNDSDTDVGFDDVEFVDNEKEAWIVVIGVVVGGIVFALANPGDPFFAFAVGAVLCGAVAWMFGTHSGREYVKKKSDGMENSQTQVGDSSSSEKKRICPNCGWQNNKRFNFCNDCGTEIKPGTDGSN